MDADRPPLAREARVIRGWLTPDPARQGQRSQLAGDRDVVATGQLSVLGRIRFIWSPLEAGAGWASVVSAAGELYGSATRTPSQLSVGIEGGTGPFVGADGWMVVALGIGPRSSWVVEGVITWPAESPPPVHHSITTRKRDAHDGPVDDR